MLIAILECTIGLCFITGKGLRVGVWLLGLQMLGAMSPLLLLAGEMFSGLYHAPSLEGQYVRKDVVPVGAGMVIAATVRGAVSSLGEKIPPASRRQAHAKRRHMRDCRLFSYKGMDDATVVDHQQSSVALATNV